ncbi:hypothetical protein [Providencia rettgeri]|uniref:hypothetical protein n=1 Tax=Providencia rettgeri TaxID=587 RepID=UPI00236292C8|nr:hypothetical protein [Providencia rettgeri]
MVDQDRNPEQISVQEPLFSLEIIELRPVIDPSTAHLRHTAIASDGCEYAVKGVNDGDESHVRVPSPMLVPAAEWFCTKLAEVSGIPTPTCRIIRNSNGEFLFGSQYELSALATPKIQTDVINALSSGDGSLLRWQFWAIYAFDQFIYNVDRHLNNYLYLKNRDGSFICKAFDFSISSMVVGWPNRINGTLLPQGCNTTEMWGVIKSLTSFDDKCRDYALKVLDNIRQVNSGTIENILNQMPDTWLNPLQRQALITWWESKEKDNRLNLVKSEVLK